MRIGGTKKRERKRLEAPLVGSKKFARYSEHYRSQPQDVVVKTTKNPFTDRRNTVQRAATKARSLPMYIAILLILICCAYAITLSGGVQIVSGKTQGLRDLSYYKATSAQVLSSGFTSKTKISLDTKNLASQLQKAIPEFGSVTVSVPIVGRDITVGVVYVEPAFLYVQQAQTYVLGSNGVILANIQDIDVSKVAGLQTITDKTPLTVKEGQLVLLQSDIDFLTTAIKELEQHDLQVTEAILPQGAGEVHIRTASKPYAIKFSLLGDVRQQVGAYLATVQQEGDAAIAEYIDVRLGERVFVK